MLELRLPGYVTRGVAGSASLTPNPLDDHAYVATHGEIFCRPIINVGSPGPFVKWIPPGLVLPKGVAGLAYLVPNHVALVHGQACIRGTVLPSPNPPVPTTISVPAGLQATLYPVGPC